MIYIKDSDSVYWKDFVILRVEIYILIYDYPRISTQYFLLVKDFMASGCKKENVI